MTAASGSWDGKGGRFPTSALWERGPVNTLILALKTHPGLLTRRTGRSVCVPRVMKCGVISDSTPPFTPLLTLVSQPGVCSLTSYRLDPCWLSSRPTSSRKPSGHI